MLGKYSCFGTEITSFLASTSISKLSEARQFGIKKKLSELTTFLLSLASASIFLPIDPAQAVPVKWTFKNGTFNDLGTMTGSFVFDRDKCGSNAGSCRNAWSNVSIITTFPSVATTTHWTLDNATGWIGDDGGFPGSWYGSYFATWHWTYENGPLGIPLLALSESLTIPFVGLLTNDGGEILIQQTQVYYDGMNTYCTEPISGGCERRASYPVLTPGGEPITRSHAITALDSNDTSTYPKVVSIGEDGGPDIFDTSAKDFGDNPESYKTLLADDGPRYQEGISQRLGLYWDEEADGQPTPRSDGDDLHDFDDEDGVKFGGFGTNGIGTWWADVTFNITRPESNPYQLRAWWDTNESGEYDHSQELYIDDLVNLSPGFLTKRYFLNFDPERYYSRFRLTLDPLDLDVKPFGEYFSKTDCDAAGASNGTCVSHGEVEDYAPIPEPLTLLGASAAIAFGAGFKRRKSGNS